MQRSKAIGFNHVALEVGDIDEALEFFSGFLSFELRSRSEDMAFIDLGDQFLALQKGRQQGPDDGRHLGLVVEDKEVVRQALEQILDGIAGLHHHLYGGVERELHLLAGGGHGSAASRRAGLGLAGEDRPGQERGDRQHHQDQEIGSRRTHHH